jgi:hypothetical protein
MSLPTGVVVFKSEPVMLKQDPDGNPQDLCKNLQLSSALPTLCKKKRRAIEMRSQEATGVRVKVEPGVVVYPSVKVDPGEMHLQTATGVRVKIEHGVGVYPSVKVEQGAGFKKIRLNPGAGPDAGAFADNRVKVEAVPYAGAVVKVEAVPCRVKKQPNVGAVADNIVGAGAGAVADNRVKVQADPGVGAGILVEVRAEPILMTKVQQIAHDEVFARSLSFMGRPCRSRGLFNCATFNVNGTHTSDESNADTDFVLQRDDRGQIGWKGPKQGQ